MNKKGFLILFCFFLGASLIHSVGASFACGSVNTDAEASPGWLNVFVNYNLNPEYSSSCLVSPENQKFCCDLEDIKEVSWGVGKGVSAGIFEDGLAAEPVSLVVSGEGYDLFPEMNVERIIDLEGLGGRIFLNISHVDLNFSLGGGFNELGYILHGAEVSFPVNVCSDCVSGSFRLNVSEKGREVLEMIARDDLGREWRENLTLFNLDYLDFSREYVCDGCRDNFVTRNAEVRVIVNVNSSHNISGILKDYYPRNWEVLDADAVEGYSDTHNAVSWEVSGKSIEKSYVLKSPSDSTPKRYYFFSRLGDIRSEESEVVLYRFVKTRLFSSEVVVSDNFSTLVESENYLSVSGGEPLVLYPQDYLVDVVALYPTKELRNVKGSLIKEDSGEGGEVFSIRSNINKNLLDRVYIKFSLPLSALDEEIPKVYNHDGGEVERLDVSDLGVKGDRRYFETWSKKGGAFSIAYNG